MSGDTDETAAPALTPASPLAIPIFRRVWAAGLVSNLGSLIQGVGAAWIMTSLSSSPVMVTLVQSSTVLPLMLLSLFAGAIADNLPRRQIMLGAQVAMLVLAGVLSAIAFAGTLTPPLLLGFTFLIGCGVAINTPAASASVGDMVPRALLPAAVTMQSMGFNVARSIGPAIGGVLVASAGARFAFLANAVSYVGMVLALLLWKPGYPRRVLPREPLGAAIYGGIRYIGMSPELRRVMLRAACFGLFASAAPALMPLVAKTVIGGGAAVFGVLSAGFGIGAIVGALLVPRLRARLAPERIVQLAVLTLAAGTAAAGLSTIAAATFVAMVVAGGGWVLGLSTFNILVQMMAPRWVVARALSCYQMSAFGAMAVGSWIIGEATAKFGVADTLLALGALQTANVLLGLVLPLPQTGARDLNPAFAARTPDTAVPVSPQSGPLVVSITYRIAADDVADFLALMAECRRIRTRDGASGWTVMRDLADPERWIERFRLATWVDYLRYLERRTNDDLEAIGRVAALHRGGDPPVVHRLLERQTTQPNARAEAGAIPEQSQAE